MLIQRAALPQQMKQKLRKTRIRTKEIIETLSYISHGHIENGKHKKQLVLPFTVTLPSNAVGFLMILVFEKFKPTYVSGKHNTVWLPSMLTKI